MGLGIRVFVLFLGCLCVSRISAQCPYARCTCQGTIISCDHRYFKVMPPLEQVDKPTYTTLNLDVNNLTVIEDKSFPENLIEITFNNNPIQEFSPGAFEASATTLESLELSGAKFTQLPTAFLSLTNLRILSIWDTPIKVWNLNILTHLGKTLLKLDLKSVGLVSWPDWIQVFPLLRSLNLMEHPIITVPDDAFTNLARSLTSLRMDRSKFANVPTAFSKLETLDVLSLAYNKIVDTTNLPVRSEIKRLFLSNNNITDAAMLAGSLLPFNRTLKELYLDGNSLKEIPDLSNMMSLEDVTLGWNQINDSTSGSFSSSVITLNLASNKFKSVPDVMADMLSLTFLDLSSNELEEVNFNSFNPNLEKLHLEKNCIKVISGNGSTSVSSLDTITLYSNPVQSISPNAFLNLNSLRTLDLSNASLTRVPLALGVLPAIKKVCLLNNPLVCTCEESTLTRWFEYQPERTVTGYCDQELIEDFFKSLALFCPEET